MPATSNSTMSRRRFLKSTGVAVAAGLLAPRELSALMDGVSVSGLVDKARNSAANAKVRVQPLRGNVSALLGAGGNIAVLHGRDGKLLIDAGYLGARPQITEALAGISPDPVKHLVNTHWHFDHTDGNEWLHSAGATILAHEKTRNHLSTSTRVEGWDYTFPPSPAGAIPTQVITGNRTLDLNGEKVKLEYYGPAHTDGDISAHFPTADVLHAGDTYWNGFYPFIDYSTGGSINGMIHATEKNLSMVTEKMIVIPGHGPVSNRSELSTYRDVLVDVRDKIAALKKQGRSLDEIVAAKPTAAYDEKWGKGFMSPAIFTGLVFQGL